MNTIETVMVTLTCGLVAAVAIVCGTVLVLYRHNRDSR